MCLNKGHFGGMVCLIKGHVGSIVCLIKGHVGRYGEFNQWRRWEYRVYN